MLHWRLNKVEQEEGVIFFALSQCQPNINRSKSAKKVTAQKEKKKKKKRNWRSGEHSTVSMALQVSAVYRERPPPPPKSIINTLAAGIV